MPLYGGISEWNWTVDANNYLTHRLIKTQIGHARDFAWYRGQPPSPARVILSHERVQVHACENLCSYATNPTHFRVRELLLWDIFITRAGDGPWPRYQAKSLACPGCDLTSDVDIGLFHLKSTHPLWEKKCIDVVIPVELNVKSNRKKLLVQCAIPAEILWKISISSVIPVGFHKM